VETYIEKLREISNRLQAVRIYNYDKGNLNDDAHDDFNLIESDLDLLIEDIDVRTKEINEEVKGWEKALRESIITQPISTR